MHFSFLAAAAALVFLSISALPQGVPTPAPPQTISFTNVAAGFHTGPFVSSISTYNDGDEVNDTDIPVSDSWLQYSPGYPTSIGFWLPDLFPGNGMSCQISNTQVTGGFPNPQVVTFTGNCSTNFFDGTVYRAVKYTLVTTQNRHYVQVAWSGRSGGLVCYGGPVWDGGNGQLTLAQQ